MATITENALDLLRKRYFNKQYGEKSWVDLCERVSRAIADAEETDELKQKYKGVFFDIMMDLLFLPSTPALINADVKNPGQLSSCFIIEVKDNIESIYQAKAECAKIFQKNGGVGFNISALRPAKADVETSKGYAGGPCDFMEEFDLTADIVTRNNIRKGAIKIDLACWHPSIQQFIHIKDDTSKLQHMNISVSITDDFMNAVVNGEDWDLKFPDYSWNKEIYNAEWDGDIKGWETKGYPVKIYETLRAKDLYREMMESAWKSGEPGTSFIDTMDRGNPNKHLGKVMGTNPCSEFCSIAFNSCNLGSINLSECGNTKDEVKKTLEWLVPVCIRFIDNMITVNRLPLDKISNITKKVRSIGLGTFGLSDLLFKLNIPYNTKDGLKYISELYSLISQLALKASIDLAEEKGCYDAWEGSEWQKKGIKIRNSNLLSIAPNGSIAFIAGEVSGGLEPQFALVMQRRTNEGDTYYIVNSVFESELRKRGLYSTELLEKIYNNHGSCKGIKEIPRDIQKVFVTAHDITPDEHLEALAIIQSFVDLSASKTINIPNNATVEDVMDIYMKAWGKGTKGVTIYRDGCRELQVLSTGSTVPNNNQNNSKYVPVRPVMQEATAKRKKIHGGCGDIWLFMVNDEEGNIQEIFTQVSGGCKANIEAISRLVSLCFRANIDPEEVFDQMSSPFCKNSFDKTECKSCSDLIAKEIKKFIKQNTKTVEIAIEENGEMKCPDCGADLVPEGSCLNCKSCGWSKCESKG
jgi:ribonucleoside-diphosphate reductase alpha chain